MHFSVLNARRAEGERIHLSHITFTSWEELIFNGSVCRLAAQRFRRVEGEPQSAERREST